MSSERCAVCATSQHRSNLKGTQQFHVWIWEWLHSTTIHVTAAVLLCPIRLSPLTADAVKAKPAFSTVTTKAFMSRGNIWPALSWNVAPFQHWPVHTRCRRWRWPQFNDEPGWTSWRIQREGFKWLRAWITWSKMNVWQTFSKANVKLRRAQDLGWWCWRVLYHTPEASARNYKETIDCCPLKITRTYVLIYMNSTVITSNYKDTFPYLSFKHWKYMSIYEQFVDWLNWQFHMSSDPVASTRNLCKRWRMKAYLHRFC